MKRTTIVLPDDLAALLDWERRRRGVSAAEVVREALDAYLNRPTGPLPFIGIGRSGERDVADHGEEILDQEWASYLLEEMGQTPEGAALDSGSGRRHDGNAGSAGPSDGDGLGEDRSSPIAPSRPEGGGQLDERNDTPEDAHGLVAATAAPQRAVANGDGERP